MCWGMNPNIHGMQFLQSQLTRQTVLSTCGSDHPGLAGSASLASLRSPFANVHSWRLAINRGIPGLSSAWLLIFSAGLQFVFAPNEGMQEKWGHWSADPQDISQTNRNNQLHRFFLGIKCPSWISSCHAPVAATCAYTRAIDRSSRVGYRSILVLTSLANTCAGQPERCLPPAPIRMPEW